MKSEPPSHSIAVYGAKASQSNRSSHYAPGPVLDNEQRDAQQKDQGTACDRKEQPNREKDNGGTNDYQKQRDACSYDPPP
jgi:hypothetical protein